MRRVCGLVIVGVLAVMPLALAAEGSAKELEKVKLFNGKDLTGWKLFVPDKNVDVNKVWSVHDGVIRCEGKPNGYIRTTKQYENYKLTWEWRWVNEGSNSGCLLHVSEPDKVWPKAIECQLMSKNAADIWLIDGTDFKEHTNKEERRVPKMHETNEKPLGEWNKGTAICDGNTIELYINGLLQNKATETTVTKGYIAFQSEGAPIEFRKIVLKPLKASAGEGSKKEGS